MGDGDCLGAELTTRGLFLGMGRGEGRASYKLDNRGRSVVHDGWMSWGVHGYMDTSGTWGNSRERALGGH